MDQEKDSRSARREGGEVIPAVRFPKFAGTKREVVDLRKTAFTRSDSTLMECRACDDARRSRAGRGFKHQNNSKLAPRIGGRAGRHAIEK